MDTHAFTEGVKVQRFCLTLVGDSRLWYGSPRHIAVDWHGLQAQFRQQYSRIGSIREHLFHVWRSFHCNGNSETIDSYVTFIRQVAALLGYGKPHVLDMFKNTLPSRLQWVLFLIEDLMQAVETAKGILTKANIGRQLEGQSTSTPFMSIQVSTSCNRRPLLFDNQNVLDSKIDKITAMMSKLTTQSNNQGKPFKPNIY